MPLPDVNLTYTKIDDDTFYISKTSSEQLSVPAIQEIIVNLQLRVDEYKAKLKSASLAGVANADVALAAVEVKAP